MLKHMTRNLKHATQASMSVTEREAVEAVRESMGQVIARCEKSDRLGALEVLSSLEHVWEGGTSIQLVSYKMANAYSARYWFLGGPNGNDNLPSDASEEMRTGLKAIDRLTEVLHTQLHQ